MLPIAALQIVGRIGAGLKSVTTMVENEVVQSDIVYSRDERKARSLPCTSAMPYSTDVTEVVTSKTQQTRLSLI